MTELISVMIVDDEKLMLEDLSTMINWEAYGLPDNCNGL